MNDRYLITGGAGFIGSHLVERLLQRGDRVRVLDNLSTGCLGNLAAVKEELEFLHGDVRSSDDLSKATKNVDLVVHLAALGSVPRSIKDPVTSHEVNSTGTLRLLESCRQSDVSRVIFASSSSVYGDSRTLPKLEGDEGAVMSPYAATKLAGEEYCRLATEIYGLDTVRLRFFNVFGPRQQAGHAYAAVIPRFIQWALSGEPILVHGDGTQSRDFTYVDNNIDGILSACGGPDSLAGEVYNLACGERRTLLDILALIDALSGTRLRVEHGPGRPGDVPHSHADITRLSQATGYRPSITVDEGISRTWDAFRQSMTANDSVDASFR